jgi:hypothetical protein
MMKLRGINVFLKRPGWFLGEQVVIKAGLVFSDPS